MDVYTDLILQKLNFMTLFLNEKGLFSASKTEENRNFRHMDFMLYVKRIDPLAWISEYSLLFLANEFCTYNVFFKLGFTDLMLCLL
jgi:hypothetical protein